MKRDYLLSCSGATMHSTNIRRRDNSRESRGRARSCYPEMERTNSLSRFPFRGEYVTNTGIDDGYFISTDMTVDDYF